MGQLIRKLEEYYKENGLHAEINEEKNHLSLKQRILTIDGFLNLNIFVTPDAEDYQKYRFACYGLGKINNATDKDLFKIELFNRNQDQMCLILDEKERAVLEFDKVFYDITSFDLGVGTVDEAMKCVAAFAGFIKSNYQELKHVIRSLR